MILVNEKLYNTTLKRLSYILDGFTEVDVYSFYDMGGVYGKKNIFKGQFKDFLDKYMGRYRRSQVLDIWVYKGTLCIALKEPKVKGKTDECEHEK